MALGALTETRQPIDSLAWQVFAAEHLSAAEAQRIRMRRLAYLARYGRQPVATLENWTTREQNQLVEAIAEIVREENASSSLASSLEDG